MRRHPAHGRLSALIGEWRFAASLDGHVTVRGDATGEWLEDGAFVVVRADCDPPTADTPRGWIDNSPFPTTAILALDDHSETFTYSYADARGVCRVYDMRLTEDTWTLDGQAGPEFFQRFRATIAADTIDGHWDASRDGESWERDFDVTYTRVARPT
jgi:hypothetical protein